MTPLVHAFLVARRNAIAWRRYWRASAVGVLGEPVFYILAFGYGVGGLVRGEVGGMDYLTYVGLALPAAAAMTAASLECTYGAYTRMDRQQTYRAIIATPIGIEEVVVGEVLWAAVHGAFSAAGTYVVLLALGATGGVVSVAAGLALSALVAAVFGAAGLVASGLARSYDHFQYFHALVTSGALLLSGAFFPLDHFAPALREAARWLPLTPVVEWSRALARGEATAALLLRCLAVEAAYLAVLVAVACAVIRRRVMR